MSPRLVLLAAVLLAGGAATLPAAAHPGPAGTPPVPEQAVEAVPGELLVGYVPGSSRAEQDRARGRAGAALAERVVTAGPARGEVHLVRLPQGRERDEAIAALEADPAVRYAEPNWLVHSHATSTDPYYTKGNLWGMYGDATSPANQFGSQAGEAWAAGNTGGGTPVYVGVIDTGMQVTHPDLDAPGKIGNPGELGKLAGVDDDGNGYVDDVHGWDFASNDNTVYDAGGSKLLPEDDHGTHVAGTIGAEANTEGVVGVSWDVRLISAKFIRKSGTTANAIRAVDYFTDLKKNRGVNVVATNNSWGDTGFSQGLLDAINRGGDAGILFISSAGNDGANNDTTAHWPSNYECTTTTRAWDCVVAVASITSTGAKASNSNYGARTVDLGAPGDKTFSTVPVSKYASRSGTSMAAPHVTGAAALYAASHPGVGADAIRAAILSAVVPTTSLNGTTVTGGRLNAAGF